MTKIRTIEHLQQVLDDELAWRKKELAVIKSLVTMRSSMEMTKCHIRAGVALIYAHWEGFIKAATTAYLTYVASQRLTYSELTDNFVAFASKRLLNEARDSNKMIVYAKVVELFTSGRDSRCILPTEIKTKSNLSSEVLKEIVYTLGLDYGDYATKANFIDETLVGNRNSIAHGNYLLVEISDFIELHGIVIDLLNIFSNQISNAASTKAYKRDAIPNFV